MKYIRHSITSTVVLALSVRRFMLSPDLFFVFGPCRAACTPVRSTLRRARAERRNRVAEPLAAVHRVDEILVFEAVVDHDAPHAFLHGMLRDGRQRNEPLGQRTRCA